MPFMSADLLLVWSSRKTGAIADTALCAFFARPQAPTGRAGVLELVRAACWFCKTPAFVYAGTNTDCRNCRELPWLRWPILVQFPRLSATRPTLCASTASS
jgi:hypothetical protein